MTDISRLLRLRSTPINTERSPDHWKWIVCEQSQIAVGYRRTWMTERPETRDVYHYMTVAECSEGWGGELREVDLMAFPPVRSDRLRGKEWPLRSRLERQIATRGGTLVHFAASASGDFLIQQLTTLSLTRCPYPETHKAKPPAPIVFPTSRGVHIICERCGRTFDSITITNHMKGHKRRQAKRVAQATEDHIWAPLRAVFESLGDDMRWFDEWQQDVKIYDVGYKRSPYGWSLVPRLIYTKRGKRKWAQRVKRWGESVEDQNSRKRRERKRLRQKQRQRHLALLSEY